MCWPSFGTREDHRKYVGIPTILISSPTFYGSATRGSSYPQGSYSIHSNRSLSVYHLFLSPSPNTKRRWHAVSDGCTWKEIGATCPVRGSRGRAAIYRCYKKVSPLSFAVLQLWTPILEPGTCSGTKVVVGTQLGILSIFNRSQGWGDCVDRVPG